MKIPKISLVLVLVLILATSLFVSCENEILNQEDLNTIGLIGSLSTFVPTVLIIQDLDIDDFEGVTLNEATNTLTWNNFYVPDAAQAIAGFLSEDDDEMAEEFIDGLGVMDRGELLIISGTTKIVEGETITITADFRLRIGANAAQAFEVPKGTFQISYVLELEIDEEDGDLIMIGFSMKVNNQPASFQ